MRLKAAGSAGALYLLVPISQNLGDRKCLDDPRKSIVGLPDAILFLPISREGVFQQPQAFAQLFVISSPFGHYAQKTCYGLTAATPSDSVVCKVKSWLLQIKQARDPGHRCYDLWVARPSCAWAGPFFFHHKPPGHTSQTSNPPYTIIVI